MPDKRTVLIIQGTPISPGLAEGIIHVHVERRRGSWFVPYGAGVPGTRCTSQCRAADLWVIPIPDI